MTGNLYLDFAISLAGVAFIVGVSWLLGGFRTARVDEASLRERAAIDEPDFVIERVFVDDDGKAGVALSDSEMFVISVVGDGFTTRRAALSALEAKRDGKSVLLILRGAGVSPVRLKLEGQSGAAETLCAAAGDAVE